MWSARPIAVLAALLVLAPSARLGAEEAPAAEAAAHFRRGGELYAEGRYREALAEFERAQELAPHPSNLFNMARCHENLGDAAAALAQYRAALAVSESPTERADIERRVAALLERPVRVFVTSRPSGARVLVDAREEPEPEPTPLTLELLPGPHRLVLTAEGHLPTPFRVDVEVGEPEPVEVALDPLRQDPCPECEGPRVVERCQRARYGGLRAHLSVSLPIGIPLVHQAADAEGEVQLLAGVGVRAGLTYDHVVVNALANIHPYARESLGDDSERSYSLLFAALEAGYVWALDVAALRLTGGIALMSDFWTSVSEDGSRTFQASNALYGYASAGLDVYALAWLSIGLDAGLGIGAATNGAGFELMAVVSAVLSFHI